LVDKAQHWESKIGGHSRWRVAIPERLFSSSGEEFYIIKLVYHEKRGPIIQTTFEKSVPTLQN